MQATIRRRGSRLATLLVAIEFVSLSRAAEQDLRMVPPRNAVTGKLPAAQPMPAKEAAKAFRVLDGFRMDLLAAEPLVASPVAMTYDENGRAYVCEMRDYPYTDKAHHQRNQENPTDEALGTVRLLEDTDGDGTFDKATIFADGLSWPTGVACWKGGVFVAATPDIWYLKDTDGDGKADVRRKVFTGFRKFNVQSVMNNLLWGLDNQIHGAGSSNGGEIRPGAKPDVKPIVMARHDFRFDPVTEQFELLSGGARFGATFDDWGHRFLCDIRNPAQHVVLPLRYLARNPYLAVASTLNDMAEAGDQLPVYRISPPEPWRVLRAKRWAGERDIVMPRSELMGAGVVTSSSGITAYRGAAYPEKYRDNVFVCEVAGNLFYRLELTSEDPTFKARRVDGQAEMVASTDNWFRPVNFVNAPDGTLHVVDMYRENIEHPWSIPDDIHAAVDLESGRERGRIWRLSPPGFKPPKPPQLGKATTLDLVAALQNPNSWWRETAQRLLFERQDASAVSALRKLLKTGDPAQGRLQALWTLAGLNAITDEDLLIGLADKSPGVRENAIKLAEPKVASETRDSNPDIWGPFSPVLKRLFELITDPAPNVRLQLAFTLGEVNHPASLRPLVNLLFLDGRNPWNRTAILSSARDRADQLIEGLAVDSRPSDVSEELRELARIVALRGRTEEIQRAVSWVWRGNSDDHFTNYNRGRARYFMQVVAGVGEGLKRSGKSLRSVAWDERSKQAIDGLLSQAAAAAADPQLDLGARSEAIRLLAFEAFNRVAGLLDQLLKQNEAHEIQTTAVAVIAGFNEPETASLFLSHWPTATPVIRAEIIVAMLNGRSRVLPLLQAIDRGTIPANQVPFARRANLFRSSDTEVKALTTKLFGNAAPVPRKEVISKYERALSLKGERNRGRLIFEQSCATCHRAGDLGKDVGPNLASIRQWNPEQVLINILEPNREVAPNFLSYTIETKDGRTLDGIITDESAASLTLKRADGLTETALRSDIANISGSGLSLMPDGFENSITVEQMADLLAFLLPSQ